MRGIKPIVKKELADHFSSYRFVIIFALIAMVSLITAYMVGINIRSQLENVAKPRFVFLMLFTESGGIFSLVEFIAFFGPLVGLILGFDTINRERSEGTLSKLLSQPIYRDVVINGKFLSGLVIIAVMVVSIVLVITGLGLTVVGVIPGFEEVWRILIYMIVSIVYISFWLGVAILFSILFRSTATSALAALAVWFFFSFFISIGANVLASNLQSQIEAGADAESIARQAKVFKAVVLVSPMKLYSDATRTIIDPMQRSTKGSLPGGPMEAISMSRFSGPLPLSQSILIVVPYLLVLTAITIVCFAVSYAVFMRQEIRSL